ncbi:MAG: Fe-S cluster assembly protein SufD [Woeseiaceae bacterium]
MSNSGLPIDALQRALKALPDTDLAPERARALQKFQQSGFPGIRHEDWKYTDLAPVIQISKDWLEAGAPTHTPVAAADSPADAIDAHWLVIANGQVSSRKLQAFAQPGITVTTLSSSGLSANVDSPLADLNTALLHDGLKITVTGDVQKPIGILITDTAHDSVGVSQARVDIDLSAGASASIIEYHVSAGSGAHFANSVVTLTLGSNATARYVRLQDRARHHCQTGRTTVSLQQDATLEHAAFDLGGQLVRNDLFIDIAGAGACATFNGLYIAGDGQHIDNHTRIDHSVGPAESRQEYRGILKGKARCVWNGKAIVHVGADGTDASQANHNLLLSRKAEIDAKPELEIYTDDVKCSHGTTVGQLDETALFYLQTRGLDKQHATRVMTHAFAAEIIKQTPVEVVHDIIASKVEERLGKLSES